MKQEHVAYVALGSNLGDREQYLKQAIEQLQSAPGVTVLRTSSLYETDPVGYVDQGAFLNMVIAVRTKLSPHQLFSCMEKVEQALGRVRDVRWGPRTIDLDLLIYGSQKIEDPILTLPHPRMSERAFVMIPLMEIYQPGEADNQVLLQELDVDASNGVRKWHTDNWDNAFAPSAN